MALPNILAALTCTIFSISASAQNQPQIKIGNGGTPHNVNEAGITEAISIGSLTKDGKLYITKDNKTYTIESFEISILPPTGNDIIGPLAINTSRGTENIDDLNNMPAINNHLHDGTRIFIEQLTASCADCGNMSTVKIKALSIRLKD